MTKSSTVVENTSMEEKKEDRDVRYTYGCHTQMESDGGREE
jgi:hypothetical protein